jgi:hypothetical protein
VHPDEEQQNYATRRCLIRANNVAEYAPEPIPETQKEKCPLRLRSMMTARRSRSLADRIQG